jgi:hypothetical protein
VNPTAGSDQLVKRICEVHELSELDGGDVLAAEKLYRDKSLTMTFALPGALALAVLITMRVGIGYGWFGSLVLTLLSFFGLAIALSARFERRLKTGPDTWFGELQQWLREERDSRTNKLNSCRECAKLVSKSAKRCPHCGVDDPTLGIVERGMKSVFRYVSLGITVFGALILIVSNPDERGLRATVLNEIRNQGGETKAFLADPLLTTGYRNFFFISVGKTKFPTDQAESTYLGVLGKWHRLDK